MEKKKTLCQSLYAWVRFKSVWICCLSCSFLLSLRIANLQLISLIYIFCLQILFAYHDKWWYKYLLPLRSILRKHSISFHCYVNYSQIHLPLTKNVAFSVRLLLKCLNAIKAFYHLVKVDTLQSDGWWSFLQFRQLTKLKAVLFRQHFETVIHVFLTIRSPLCTSYGGWWFLHC